MNLYIRILVLTSILYYIASQSTFRRRGNLYGQRSRDRNVAYRPRNSPRSTTFIRRSRLRTVIHLKPKITDTENSPFRPALRKKPNAIKPLDLYLEQDEDGVDYYCHPYMHELDAFQVPQNQLKRTEPILPATFHNEVAYVDNAKSLAAMITDLRDAKELALDSEYDMFHSYFGYTCLLQISTRTHDYLIDALALKDQLEVLNRFFTDPNILKVFQDASNDVIWLQKDLNLYLVNVFDTVMAAHELGMERQNIPFLLKQLANMDMIKNRKFQKFYDWRTRPLSKGAKSYARNDTHYLLYLHDLLRNELIDRAGGSTDLLLRVYNNATQLCKTRFKKTTEEDDYLKLLHSRYLRTKNETKLNVQQIYALRLLFQWRDEVARKMNAECGNILPNKALFRIVKAMPMNLEDLRNCYDESNMISDVVHRNLRYLLQLITKARHFSGNPKKVSVYHKYTTRGLVFI